MRHPSVALTLLVALACVARAEEKKPAANDDAAVKKRLAEQKMTVDFDEKPAAEVVVAFRDLSGLNVVLDAAARDELEADEVKVTLKLKDAFAKDVLEKILAKTKLAHEVWKGIVWISTKDGLGGRPPKPKIAAPMAKKLEKTVNLDCEGTPLSEVFTLLKDVTGVAFKAAEGVDAEQIVVSVKLKDVKAADAVEVLCRLTGLAAESRNGGIVVIPREDAKDDEKKK
jgi:hypothetical protein